MRTLTLEDLLSLRLPMPHSQAPSLSPDGRFLACTLRFEGNWADNYVQTFDTGAAGSALGAELWLFDLVSQDSRQIMNAGRSWRPSWSPGGDKLAFYSDQTGTVNLWCWKASTGQTVQLSKEPVFSRMENDAPAWSPDGSRVFVPLRPEGWEPGDEERLMAGETINADESDAPTVDVLISPPPPEEKFPFWNESSEQPSDIGVVDVTTGETTRLLAGFPIVSFLLSPDGEWLALSGGSRIQGVGTPGLRIVRNLYLMNSSRGEPQLVREDLESIRTPIRHDPAWSVDSRNLAFITGGQIHVLEVASGETREHEPEIPASTQYLKWTPDGNKLLFLESTGREKFDRTTPCVLNLDNGEARRLNLPYKDEPTTVVGSQGTGWIWSEDNKSCLILTQASDTKQAEFWRIPLDGGSGTPLYRGDIHVSHLDISSGDTETTIVFAAESASAPPDFWKTGPEFTEIRKVTDINPHLKETLRGTARLVPYLTTEGEQAYGALLLPPDFQEGEPIPVVCEIYPTDLSRSLNRWNPAGGVIPLQLLASRGYGVFLPDSRPGDYAYPATAPLTSTVLPAVTELVRLGIADPDRLGVMGQSAGGWAVNLLITQTNRFKAAVCAAGLSNLVSMFGGLTILANGMPYAHGEGLMEAAYGGPPWEQPVRYIEHSPVFHLHKVETPLLLLHGTDDPGVPVGQPGEMFVGLRRLGKKVTFARYRGEGHIPGMYSLPNRRDVVNRVTSWFDEHLKA